MGRTKRKGQFARTMKRDFKDQRSPDWKHEKRVRKEDGSWGLTHNYSNEDFEEYYKAQSLMPEGEWDEFLTTLKTVLPTTFRINSNTKFAADLRHKLENDLFSHFHSEPIEVDGEMVDPPKALPWYPNRLAWQFSFSRQQLRKTPELTAIHEFVKRENECGSITRQEAVSMVPPLFLDVKPEHMVLDMCAAPGSKTFQILEMLHTGCDAPPGLVVANDADMQRCNLLTHQTKRHCSPCLIVTNHEGQFFPHVTLPGQADKTMFDRILCDVPCSGDGTLRKAPDIWKKWSVGNGIALHPLQVRITLQAARLLHVGGRMVYSTCTFNPIENEAVVAEVLRRTKGSLQLVDVRDRLPELRRGPGLLTWKVKDKLSWYETFADVGKTSKVNETMFPAADLAELNIQRCMRFLPHHQDTGGFFVCVLEKVAPTNNVDSLPTKKERQAIKFAERKDAMATGDDVSTAVGGESGKAALPADGAEAGKEEAPSAGVAEPGPAATSAPPASVDNPTIAAAAAADATNINGKEPTTGEEVPGDAEAARLLAESSVRAMGLGAVAHNTSVDSDAEGGAMCGASGGTGSTAQAPHRPLPTIPGRRFVHHNQSVGTAPITQSLNQPALSVGQSASADTVQAPGSYSVADDVMSNPPPALGAESKLQDSGGGSTRPGSGANLQRDGSVNVGWRGQRAEGGEVVTSVLGGGGAANSAAPGADTKPPTAPKPPQWGARGGGSRNREGGKFKGMDPILPVHDDDLLDSVYDFYGLPGSFPLRTQLITRSNDAGRPKRIYFVSSSIRNLLAADKHEKLKIQATGVKVLERQDPKEATVRCFYRLTQEGLPCIVSQVTKQLVRPSLDMFMRLLEERSFPLPAEYRAPEGADAKKAEAGEERAKPPPAAAATGVNGAVQEEVKQAGEEGAELLLTVAAMEVDGEAKEEDGVEAKQEGEAGEEDGKEEKEAAVKQAPLDDKDMLEQLKDVRMGGCVAMIKDSDAELLGLGDSGAESLAISCYRGMSSINILVSKQEAAQLAEKITAARQAKAEAAEGAATFTPEAGTA
mmetsp:Transcript_15450/g.43228  ORF Transcript_15450/g.43228 Transcript_15450/m.43228 type:complete len:1047 (+) Transcript_15450:183-3323(+)